LFESDTLGNTQTEYVWLGNQRLATINGTGTYYSHNDHLGTPQLMTNSAGTTVWQADYDPFGKATVTTATVENNLRFPGQYYDSETGNHYNYFRDYDPSTGRYVQSDPIGLRGGFNKIQNSTIDRKNSTRLNLDLQGPLNHLYVYTGNNPTGFIDPLGLASACVTGCTVAHTTCILAADFIGTAATLVCIASFPELTIPCVIVNAGAGVIANILCDNDKKSCIKGCGKDCE